MFPRTVVDQQLLFEENRLCDDGPYTAGAEEREKSNDDIDEKDEEIAHPVIAANIANSRNCGATSRESAFRQRHPECKT